MTNHQSFSANVLNLDCEKEYQKIAEILRETISHKFRRRGAVVGVSGGIDSSVTVTLCAKALGSDRVLALLMPERHSADETLRLSKSVAENCGVQWIHEDISGILESVSFYRRYDEAVQTVIPKYGAGWKSKIVIPNIIEHKGFTVFSIVAQSPEGEIIKKRLSLDAYLQIVAATNFKQRIRKMLEYYHADRLNYAVMGTPNRLEYDQGFFVKLGDGAADFKPIAHLYKSQVYQLAAYLNVPEGVRNRPPTTDTYSLAQGQDEFFFSLPYDKMDLCLYGKNNGISPEAVGNILGFSGESIQRIYDDIDTKRKTTQYMHLPPALAEKVPEITYD